LFLSFWTKLRRTNDLKLTAIENSYLNNLAISFYMFLLPWLVQRKCLWGWVEGDRVGRKKYGKTRRKFLHFIRKWRGRNEEELKKKKNFLLLISFEKLARSKPEANFYPLN